MKIKFPFEVKRGSVSIKIYKTPSHGCDSFTLSYYQDGLRKRPTFANFKQAKREAEIVAGRLAATDADVLTLSSADRAAYQRARQVLDPIGVPIETASVEFASAKARLGSVPLSQAVDFYLKRHPKDLASKMVKEVADEMIKLKRADKLSERYVNQLEYDMNRFTSRFRCNLGNICGTDVDQWLRDLGVGPRTRNNLRNSVQALFNFGIARKYLPTDHDEMNSVPVAKDKGGEIEIFTPGEMVEMLSVASPKHIPFLAISAFAGVRHAELQRMDWVNLKREASIIEIKAGTAKTASRRVIPILPNLAEWLKPQWQNEGPISQYAYMGNEFMDLTQRVNEARSKKIASANQKAKGIPVFKWKHNALRHSFISYRVAQTQNVAQVALEAGNSPQMIFKHYRELVRPKDAEAWFAIMP